MELKELREQLETVDTQMADLLRRRMELVKQVAQVKAEQNLPIYDPAQERKKLARLTEYVGQELAPAAETLFSDLFDLSRSEQRRHLGAPSPIRQQITYALEHTPKLPPARPLVAVQGAEGAYAQMACDRLFPSGNILYFSNFEGVFSAVEQGLCRYGILPLENSTAGSVNRIYDLMMEHEFYITQSCRVKVDHCLLAKKGTKREDIRQIVSHEQAISQCRHFLSELPNVKVTAFANTALAAKAVAESEGHEMAALSSRYCAELYGLECLETAVQDQGANYTRFICISKEPEIYPGANRTSLMVVLPNRPGSLHRVLSRFHALGINLTKLESRPIANTNFEFMFYFDLEESVYSEQFLRVFEDLDGVVGSIKYLGSYNEVI